MNLLAHLYLSADDPAIRIGNLIADFVKGPNVARLPAAIQTGIRQHRLIDGFTDRHPVVQKSITRISHDWGWFSGIIIDVYYDHLLARDWQRWAAEPLRMYADRMYDEIRGSADLVDLDHRGFIPALIADDRLVRYATADGIRDTLAKVSARIAARMPERALPLEEAMPLLNRVDTELHADFQNFFPEVRAFASSFLTT